MTVTQRIVLVAGLLCGCTAPHYIWPQKDIGVHEINPPTAATRMLVASRDSEFKRVLIGKIIAAYEGRPVYIKIIGIDALPEEDAGAYSAVVVINTAMGWTVDVPVERFLKQYGQLGSIIVLTTADGGNVFPDMTHRHVDAISSASVMDQAGPLAEAIIGRIDRLIQ